MNNHDYITQDSEPEDRIYLHRRAFPVNIRLLKTSTPYREHIQGILSYMQWTLDQRWDDYASAKDGGTFGISGANLAIPYNIIGWRSSNKFRYMLNPTILKRSDMQIEQKSNCGSIKLLDKIPVLRHREVKVAWYDIEGKRYTEQFIAKEGGATIQHEVDHNNGVLITDRFIEQGGSLGDIAHLMPKKRELVAEAEQVSASLKGSGSTPTNSASEPQKKK